MKKIDELHKPDSCLSKALLGERIFVLLGRDIAAPEAIRAWAAKRVSLGENRLTDPQISEALDCAEAMERECAAIRGEIARQREAGGGGVL